MTINSRLVAFLLASTVCLVTVAFLSVLDTAEPKELVLVGCLSFASVFLLSYVAFEFLIFREIKNLTEAIDKINRKGFKGQVSERLASSPSTNPLRLVRNEIEAYAGRKQKEIDELKKLEIFRREFIADVSHELKTPLFAAQGFVLTLLDGAVDDEAVRYKFLKKAAKSLDGLSMLIQDLLTLGQIESGDITMHFEDLDLTALARDIFDQLEAKAKKRGSEMVLLAPPGQPLWVHADYTRLGQVLTNLLGNAIKYGKEEGRVTLELLPQPGRVTVRVSDDGPGIAKEHLKRIFERFYRVEKSRSRQQGGSGLGLAIVKHILEKHQAPISVSSELGQGTTFTFDLPLVDGH
ncbi:MAG: ATP-binding protein [Bernardetiaceae bacterium]|jgi:two-component system phosphate regulon sensor histidine kinase PhoR|nr:ATP-binding protein [Bernardetiaceae bacterium]